MEISYNNFGNHLQIAAPYRWYKDSLYEYMEPLNRTRFIWTRFILIIIKNNTYDTIFSLRITFEIDDISIWELNN